MSIFRDGDSVKCGKRGARLIVKYREKDAILVSVPKDMKDEALRCRDCGFIVCVSCSLPSDLTKPSLPRCPNCGSLGGPYPFFKE